MGSSSMVHDFEAAMHRFISFVRQLTGDDYTVRFPPLAVNNPSQFPPSSLYGATTLSSAPFSQPPPFLAGGGSTMGSDRPFPPTASMPLITGGVHPSQPINGDFSGVSGVRSDVAAALEIHKSHPSSPLQQSFTAHAATVPASANLERPNLRSLVEVVQQPTNNELRQQRDQRPGTRLPTQGGQVNRCSTTKPRGFNRRFFPSPLHCYRCGDRGHRANTCRNALVWFSCGRLGHRAANCKAITTLPPDSRPFSIPQMAPPTPARLIKAFPNRANREILAVLERGLVFRDTFRYGISYIRAHLGRIFPEYSHSWSAKALPEVAVVLPMVSHVEEPANQESNALVVDPVPALPQAREVRPMPEVTRHSTRQRAQMLPNRGGRGGGRGRGGRGRGASQQPSGQVIIPLHGQEMISYDEQVTGDEGS
ncbi:hypothetical protein FCM35_KLT18487 [Carex littledalei]|uniref:CCHC-type domain-containing protein n=1 Tax=Carex littledalei TaxID=544730 RepID=A0A833R3P6_9POAL|nr:hypothetical protein FCM35_KLT18487 [Carex littledalei]